MLYDIVEAKVVKNYTLFLRFENGVKGHIDISKIIPFEGIFSKLQDIDYFATVVVDKELGTIVWDNGADLSPEYLYTIISGTAA
ncbi:MAG: DUF2442 domain-containing protein [Chlamydiales bacterium]|nr:DUF2442 domain-containing protein [Chlamydiales bacterium]